MRHVLRSPVAVGAVAVAVIGFALFVVFWSWNPFSDPYRLEAAFRDTQNLKAGSPVRIAGVDVGQVTGIEPIVEGEGAGLVKMEIYERGLPIFENARLLSRPRLFLEGNYYIDLKPGTPTATKLESGSSIPITQTASSVSIDQVLRVFQRDTREELKTLLSEYGSALSKGGAEAFNDSIPWWAPAYRNTAIANEALMGTERGDLKRVLRGQQQTFAALSRDPEALKGLISNLNATTAAFAREDDALAASIPALRDVLSEANPTLRALDATFPGVRRFARDVRPAVRSTAPTIDALQPFISQLRALVQEDELKGLAADLRQAVPALARTNREVIPLLERFRRLSSCTENVLVPFAETPIPDPDFPDASGEPFYQDAPRSFVGLSGESRTHDANGQFFRVLAGGGPTTLVETPASLPPAFSQALFPSLGTRPEKPRSRPVFRPGVPCETQEPPNMEARGGVADASITPQPQLPSLPSLPLPEELRLQAMEMLKTSIADDRAGRPTDDPATMGTRELRRKLEQDRRERP